MLNTTSNPPKMGNTSLPLAAIQQWIEADSEDTASSWNYVSGLLSGILIYRPDITEELTFLVGIAAIRAGMASQETGGKYSLLTPSQRLQELFGITTRMKAHSAVLGQIFTRPATKKAALEGMDKEISNLLILWESVKEDVEEMGAQS